MDAMTFLREQVPLFDCMSDENLAVLAEASTILPFNAGQSILIKGTTVDGLHVIVSGMAGVYIKPLSKAAVQVAALKPGEVCGEMSIVEMGIANAAVKAIENNTLVLMIPQEAFRHVLQQDESFAVRVNTLIKSRRTLPVVLA